MKRVTHISLFPLFFLSGSFLQDCSQSSLRKRCLPLPISSLPPTKSLMQALQISPMTYSSLSRTVDLTELHC